MADGMVTLIQSFMLVGDLTTIPPGLGHRCDTSLLLFLRSKTEVQELGVPCRCID